MMGFWALLLLACAGPQVDPRQAFLDKVEEHIRPPPEAKPLGAYYRSYFPMEGGTRIMGIFSLFNPPGRHWVSQDPGPFVADGGCAIVTVVVDASTGAIEEVRCNGVG